MSDNKALFKPVKTQRTFEEVSSKIKALVFEGLLKSGDKLPSEKELARQFNVGRQTIREALRILELSGFITIKKGYDGGAIIKNNISEKITSLILDAFRMENISVNEFTIARLTIEKAILDNAIDNADEHDIAALRDNIARAKGLIAQKKIAVDLNFKFHSLLATASKNSVFMIVEGAVNALHRNLRSRTPADFKLSETAVQDHEEILEALIKKKRTKAIALLKAHILKMKSVYKSNPLNVS